MATFGSPLRKLYHWAFPAIFTNEALSEMADDRAGIGSMTWRNYYYETDPIGGRTTQTTPVDIRLKDPTTCNYTFGQPPPPVGSHTGYWRDSNMWSDIDELAGILDPPFAAIDLTSTLDKALGEIAGIP